MLARQTAAEALAMQEHRMEPAVRPVRSVVPEERQEREALAEPSQATRHAATSLNLLTAQAPNIGKQGEARPAAFKKSDQINPLTFSSRADVSKESAARGAY